MWQFALELVIADVIQFTRAGVGLMCNLQDSEACPECDKLAKHALALSLALTNLASASQLVPGIQPKITQVTCACSHDRVVGLMISPKPCRCMCY